jgi:hypothetical protein
MPSTEYYDTLRALFDCRKLVSEAQSRGLPMLSEGKDRGRLGALMLKLDLLDPYSSGSPKLRSAFLETLDKIAPGRNFGDFSQVEVERVALALTSS